MKRFNELLITFRRVNGTKLLNKYICFEVNFTRPWKYSYTSPCVRDQSDRLWQCTARERAKNYDWQAAARPERRRPSHTRKFDRGLTHILHDELHWLDVPQRVAFRLCTTVYKCLHGLAPLWSLCARTARSWSPPTPLCKPTSILSSLQHDNLRSTCVFVRQPSRLELTAWKCAQINIYSHLQTLSKDIFIFIRADYAFSALGAIHFFV